MTDDIALLLRDKLIAKLATLPVGAVRRLMESDPTEGVVIQARVFMLGYDDTVIGELTCSLMHSANSQKVDGTVTYPAAQYETGGQN